MVPARWGKFEGRGIRRIERDYPPPSDADQLHAIATLGAALDGLGAKWWLTYGALLGWVRGGRFLPDDDIDIAVMASGETAAEQIALAVARVGFASIQEWLGPSGTRMLKGHFGRCRFDLFFVVPQGEFLIDEYPVGSHRGGRSFARGTHLAMPIAQRDLGGLKV